ncbi:MAG TPA: Gfo/Idh/MocA family oxidoreductase [Phycisphaerales bacterium]|nr:Gfo/Idh/MocA family oxidoreductase [Phycisphaerales bacterium]
MANIFGRPLSRREFVKGAATASAASVLLRPEAVFAAGSETLNIALIGCGGRGAGAVEDCFRADPNVRLVAMADLFEDRLGQTLNWLRERHDATRIKVTPETCFVGFDAYHKVCAMREVDIVLDASPPHFRPIHLKAAIEAGKHSFIEKPAAVDPAGVRSVIETAELAAQKGLSIVAGTQRRHQNLYLDVVKRLQDGQIGEILSANCYWCGADMLGYWKWYDREDMDDIQFQCRNWPWFTWTSGDHIVEQHVHNIDVVNWVLDAHPISAMALGGRQARTLGNIYDHFTVEFEYPGNRRVTSMSRQINGCADRIGEFFRGSDGTAILSMESGVLDGKRPYRFQGQGNDPMVQEHKDLIEAIRSGSPVNHAKRIAESTMTAIIGRMSAYTGRAIRWDWAMRASTLDYTLPSYTFGDRPAEPVAIPGKTVLI